MLVLTDVRNDEEAQSFSLVTGMFRHSCNVCGDRTRKMNCSPFSWRHGPCTLLLIACGTTSEDLGRSIENPVYYETRGHRVAVRLAPCADDIYLTLYETSNLRLDKGKELLFIHGMCHTAHFYEPLTRTVFRHFSNVVTRKWAINLPGPIRSEIPDSCHQVSTFTLEDHLSAVLQTLAYIGRQVELVVGHSMGGILVQMLGAQPDICDRYGVKAVLLLAPGFPREIPADVPSQLHYLGNMFTFLPLIMDNIDLTTLLLDFTDDSYLAFFFSDRDGRIVEGAPTAPQALAKLKSPESLSSVLESALLRPSVPAGALSRYLTAMVAYEYDLFFPPDIQRQLYEYLTKTVWLKGPLTTPSSGFYLVRCPQCIHDDPYLHPEHLVPTLHNLLYDR